MEIAPCGRGSVPLSPLMPRESNPLPNSGRKTDCEDKDDLGARRENESGTVGVEL
jgi:hypothetical protein